MADTRQYDSLADSECRRRKTAHRPAKAAQHRHEPTPKKRVFRGQFRPISPDSNVKLAKIALSDAKLAFSPGHFRVTYMESAVPSTCLSRIGSSMAAGGFPSMGLSFAVAPF